MPSVSIVTPFRDAAAFLPDLVRTVQQQTCPDWECLLVDDHSQDRGGALLDACCRGDRRFRLLSLPAGADDDRNHRLPARPRNHALGHLRSPLVAFLDCDDLWHPRKLEHQLAFHQAAGLDLSVTAYGRFRSQAGPLRAVRCPPRRLSLPGMRRSNPIPLLTVLVRSELLAGGFPLVPHEDYLLWLNLQRNRPELRYGVLPELLAFYRLHRGNQTRHHPRVVAWTYRAFRRHGLGRSDALRQLLLWSASQSRRLLAEWTTASRGLPCQSVRELLQLPPLPVDAAATPR